MNKFFRYSGAKDRFTPLINSYLKTDKKIYCEPFVGSGGVLFNLNKDFDRYIINDIDRNIIRIYKTFKEIDYNYYISKVNEVFDKFGKIKLKDDPNGKQNYYNFRNWFNINCWKTETIDEGIYLHILANSCINSFFRFGPNGMNSSFGNCCYLLNEKTFNNINSVLQKTEIYNSSYKNLLKEDAFFFFDPPYASQNSSYAGFSFEDQREFLELIKDKEYLYTDILNEINEKLENKIIIREMVSTAPNSDKSKNSNMECLFSSNLLNNNW